MVNYDYISTVLCENVDKPEMACNGKCHLAKELNQSLEHKGPAQTSKVNFLFEFISTNAFQISYDQYFDITDGNTALDNYKDLYCYLFSSIILQPPIV